MKATSGSRSPRTICPSLLPVSEAALPSLQHLIDELTSGDEGRAEAAAQAFAMQPDLGVDVLRQLLNHGDLEQRWWAVRALAGLPSSISTPALVAALSDPEAGVRQAAALGLRGHIDGTCLDPLIAALADPDPLVARLASDALASAGAAAVPPLSAAVLDPRARVRLEATRALANNPDPAVVPALFRLLQDPSPLVTYWAEHGLDVHGQGMVFFPP